MHFVSRAVRKIGPRWLGEKRRVVLASVAELACGALCLNRAPPPGGWLTAGGALAVFPATCRRCWTASEPSDARSRTCRPDAASGWWRGPPDDYRIGMIVLGPSVARRCRRSQAVVGQRQPGGKDMRCQRCWRAVVP